MPQSVRSDASNVVELCAAYGLVLDDWQAWLLDGILGERPDGLWQVQRAALSIPRQNGKGSLIEALELGALLYYGEKTIVHSAHEYRTAADGFRRLLAYFENYDDLRKKVKRVFTAAAREFIEFHGGQRIQFITRTKSAMRGFSLDRLIIDEAQELGDAAWDAILPTLSARPNPQVVLLGTPPTPLTDSSVFERMRQNGLEGADDRLLFAEWSAAPNAEGEQAVAQANPAYGIRLRREQIQAEADDMSPEGYGRERLGRWADGAANAIFGVGAWEACAGPEPASRTLQAVGLAATRDLTHCGITGAGWSEGRLYVKPLDHAAGTAWVVDRFQALGVPVSVDAMGPAGVLIPHLETAGIEVVPASTSDVLDACGDMQVMVRDQVVLHPDDPGLNRQVASARKRSVRDRWALDRTSDVTLLEAAIHAARLARAPAPAPTVSAYEARGVMSI